MGQADKRTSPRQRMINLMYIVLTAMLALNVSSDVLDAFNQVEDGLSRTNKHVTRRNDAIFAELQSINEQNPAKAGAWYGKAVEVRAEALRLTQLIDSLKMEVARQADGADADPSDIQNREDLESASVVMLNPVNRRGEELRKQIDVFRSYISAMLTDSAKRASIEAALSTEPFRRKGVEVLQKWEESKFENQPVVAAITLLTKLQNDIKYAEGEALSTLLAQVDAGDVHVNELSAFVIPESRFVMRGSRYNANIVLAALDTTSRPRVIVGGREIPGGKYQAGTGSTGTFSYSGYIEMPHADGTVSKHPFKSEYTVMEPSATVSATMMNVMYAGIDNPISISVPGIPVSAINASMTNGSLTRQGDHWVARPSTVGTEAVITVTANVDGRQQTMNTTSFRVRKLPDPTAYITIGSDRYKGGRPVAKASLMNAKGLNAAIDDDMLNIEFKVLSFETVFFDQLGNAIPEVSAGSQFSQRQQEQMRRLSRGKRFYISRIKAKGPDGVERSLSPVEVIVN
ncbi:MAG: gliding motility protein GldM [Muribaculaceae bacterium]|nr:gliding motility protein GldM [Muribaculaceae bacterium]